MDQLTSKAGTFRQVHTGVPAVRRTGICVYEYSRKGKYEL